MKKKRFLLRTAMMLLVMLCTSMTAWSQYVFVIGNPANGGEVRVGKSLDLGAYMDGSSLIDDAQPGDKVYFDFRPYEGYEFTGQITIDNLVTTDDLSVDENGIYSFTMPAYEGMAMIMIYIGFKTKTVIPAGSIEINEENFPDANFRKWLISYNGNKKVINPSTVTKISARECGIQDLTGIQLFTELTELDVLNFESTPEVKKNKITSIDLSANTKLRKLVVCENQIASLDLSACSGLRHLDVTGNLLTELDVANLDKLSLLYCADNQLTSLDVSHNPDLGVLACYENNLTNLNVANNLSLEQLFCENNQLSSIDVTNHNKLMLFNCNDNQLTSLDVTGCSELFQLYCYNNKIKGEAMTNLVNSLETPPHGGYMVIIDLESETEENEMSEELAAAAKAKGWSVEAVFDDDYVSYPYNPNVHQYVDLGLPSGTLWATTNIGATHPYQSGLFFAWGDTEGHGRDVSDGYMFNWENYKWGEVIGEDTYFTKYCTDSSRGKDGFTDGKYELDLEDDAAYVNWGPQWRMPSKEQFDELRNNCTWTRMYLGDVYGYDVEGPNGRSIFLPDTGWRIDDMLLDGGAFWTRTSDPESTGVGGAYYLGWDAYEWEHFAWYEYGGRLDGQCIRPVVNRLIELADNEDNSETIENAANNGNAYDVKLCNRTLYKDGTWNTLCLPFALDEAQIETMLDSPEAIMTLSTTNYDAETSTLTLNFVDATTIEAGKPYIIKWEASENSDNSESSELKNPTFSGVILSNTMETVLTEYAEFIGTTSPVTLAAGNRDVLYLGANNTLYSPSVDKVVKSCYAYFELKGGIKAGDKANGIRFFRLNFGDGEATSISRLDAGSDEDEDGNWYAIDGRRMNGKPTAKGLYINKGHKLFIK